MHQSAYRPLEGVRILDLCKLVPGDLATRKLAELGADVVKLEDAGTGDPVRLIPPFLGENSVHHWNLNRAKRSVAADLRTAEGKALFHALADKADAIVEVSVPGRFEKLGIDFAAMRRQRPQLVICSITGFGQTGPWSTLPSHGMNMDALAGNVILTQRNGYPAMDYRLSSSVSSELGAMNAALAVSASIFAAREGRGGCWIDISCWDAGFEMHRAGIAKQMSAWSRKMALTSAMPCFTRHIFAATADISSFVQSNRNSGMAFAISSGGPTSRRVGKGFRAASIIASATMRSGPKWRPSSRRQRAAGGSTSSSRIAFPDASCWRKAIFR
jgi:crotonobetainyl-CoA:carnitine CoA-transferase CaiB-like acyl-CoA transferase